MKTPTILVIEDNALNMKLVRCLLNLNGYQVLEAEDAEKGLQLASIHRPDLILMDLQLPGMDGLEATRIMKNREELKNIPVVALTSYALPGDEEKAREAFCSGYITKPIDTRKFIKTLKGFLDPESRTAQTGPAHGVPGKPRILIVDDDPLNIKLLKAKLPVPKFETLSATNGLTALHNRAYFKNYFDQELKRASRQKYPVALIIMDIDNFKQINDSSGHMAGDHILTTMGSLINKSIREIDLSARYGSDEFVLVLPYADQEKAFQVVNRLQKAIETCLFSQENGTSPEHLTVSMGIAFFPHQGSTPEEVIRKAELALYQAKREGKNRYHVYS